MATQRAQAPDVASVVAARGGSFLIEDRLPEEVFTPEDFTDEQRMIAETAADFMDKEMAPQIPEILALNYGVTRALLKKAGDLGLLGVEVPEEYGGLGLDKVSGCLVSEKSARDGSFAVAFMGHTGAVGLGSSPSCQCQEAMRASTSRSWATKEIGTWWSAPAPLTVAAGWWSPSRTRTRLSSCRAMTQEMRACREYWIDCP